jgi:predicted transcriptional regulator
MMPDNETDSRDEKLLILPLGNESKKITQVISNDTARLIIELLADAPLTASDISERLHAPLTTIIYNLENLENVGLVRVEKIKYSEKGRVVKVYTPVRKIIVVVQRRQIEDRSLIYSGNIWGSFLQHCLLQE